MMRFLKRAKGTGKVGGSAISKEFIKENVPVLLTKFTIAETVLKNLGLLGKRVPMYLVVDYSGSMRKFYPRTMQIISDRTLAGAAHLDDDEKVPVIAFSTDLNGTETADLTEHVGFMERFMRKLGNMGGTNYAPAFRKLLSLHKKKQQGLVVFITDGGPQDFEPAEKQLQKLFGKNLFVQALAVRDPYSNYDVLKGWKRKYPKNFGFQEVDMSMQDDQFYNLVFGEFSKVA
jgi:hypothetical protein